MLDRNGNHLISGKYGEFYMGSLAVYHEKVYGRKRRTMVLGTAFSQRIDAHIVDVLFERPMIIGSIK
jgi:hypothetical protein